MLRFGKNITYGPKFESSNSLLAIVVIMICWLF